MAQAKPKIFDPWPWPRPIKIISKNGAKNQRWSWRLRVTVLSSCEHGSRWCMPKPKYSTMTRSWSWPWSWLRSWSWSWLRSWLANLGFGLRKLNLWSNELKTAHVGLQDQLCFWCHFCPWSWWFLLIIYSLTHTFTQSLSLTTLLPFSALFLGSEGK